MKRPAIESIMEGFHYQKGELHCELVSLASLAREFGTPLYVYSRAGITNRIRRLQLSCKREGLAPLKIHFAVKAASNLQLLKLIRQLGCGADIVSGGELFRAALAGFSPNEIMYSGVGKSPNEIARALDARIHSFNVESIEELHLIDSIAAEKRCSAQVLFRVNPNVDAKTHPYISTGLKKNKFGLSKEELRDAVAALKSLRHIRATGLSCHIGSQILSLAPFEKAWRQLRALAESLPFRVEELDLGGGVGIAYGSERAPSLESFGRLIQKVFPDDRFQLSIEPGRSIIGPTSVLLTTVLIRKSRPLKKFVVVDAGMNDLMRPALYGSVHTPFVVRPKTKARRTEKTDLVGPVCETGDTFQENVLLPPLDTNDLLVFSNAGAYGMSMASQYNSRPRPAEVLVHGDRAILIRKRETYDELIQNEIL